MNESDRNPDQPSYLVAGLVSLIPLLGIPLARRLGWDQDFLDLILMGCTSLVLFRLMPEQPRFSRLSGILLLAGIAIGGLSFWVRFRNNLDGITVTGPYGLLGVGVYVVLMVVLIPLWEEKSCRQILFFGIGRYTGLWLSALLVSGAFAWVHQGNALFSLLFSLTACALAFKGVSTFDRTILHGAINLAQVLPWLYFGYKF